VPKGGKFGHGGWDETHVEADVERGGAFLYERIDDGTHPVMRLRVDVWESGRLCLTGEVARVRREIGGIDDEFGTIREGAWGRDG
jgi:hypothetical protein